MRVAHRTVTALVCALLLLSSCDGAGPSGFDEARDTGPTGRTTKSPSPCSVIGGYEICLTSVLSEEGSTTFAYTVTPSGATAHLRRLVIGYQTCDPGLDLLDATPNGISVVDDDVTSVSGALFTAMQRKNQVKEYTVVFAGEVAAGEVPAGVSLGSGGITGTVLGAVCEPPVYAVGGSVYIESDAATSSAYGTREESEAGLQGVTVRLMPADETAVLTADGQPLETLTNSAGDFLFADVPSGSYHLLVPATTPESDDNNEILYRIEANMALYSFAHPDAITVGGQPVVPVTVGPDVQVDLGFAPNAEAIGGALGGNLATRNELPFTRYLPLLAGLSTPEEIAAGRVPLFSQSVGSYSLSFLGRAYDATADRTTYTYQLRRLPGKGHDVSHVTFGVASCQPIATQPRRVEWGVDPTTGVSGVKFDFGVKREQTYQLVYAGNVNPGVIDVGVKYATQVPIVPMPGACGGAMGSVDDLLRSLASIYYSGSSDEDYLFLKNPLVLPGGATELAAAISLLLDRTVEQNSVKYLQQYLLVAQLIFDRGYGTPLPTFDATIFQFVEPIILFESQHASASKTGSPTAGTGGSRAGGSVLGSYVER